MSDLASSFPPISSPDARILILGSMPGQASLAAGQYYAHPRNAFWPIMGRLLGFHPATAYADRAVALRAARIALWDVVHSCARPGSLDASIDRGSALINDFTTFFAEHPSIGQVFFNGLTAESLFRKAVLPSVAAPPDLLRLPSTSPAHAALSFERKLAAWQAALSPVLPCRAPVQRNSQ